MKYQKSKMNLSTLVGIGVVVLMQNQPALAKTAERLDFGYTFKVSQIPGDPIKLRLRGETPYKPSYVDRYTDVFPGPLESKIENDSLVLSVDYTVASNKQTFDHTVELPPNVRRVVFGTQRKEIWPHDEGLQYSTEQRKACDAAIAQFRIDYPQTDSENYYVGVLTHRQADDSTLFVGLMSAEPLSPKSTFLVYSVKKSDYSATCIERSGNAILTESTKRD